MRRIAAVAATATMLMAAQAPRPQTQPARPPAQAPAPVPAQRPAAPKVPTRLLAGTLGNVCSQDRSACLTYILGATDAFASALVAAGRPQAFCIPPGTTNDQVAQSVVRFLRAHPEETNTNAALIVLAGLKASYPCGY
ncbi:MAG: Rap1a/Tai family immunity protein [Allosphingosinicella sp.]